MPVQEKDGRFIWGDDEPPQAVPVEGQREGSAAETPASAAETPIPPPGLLVGVGLSVPLTPEEGAALAKAAPWNSGPAWERAVVRRRPVAEAVPDDLPTEHAAELLAAAREGEDDDG